MPRLVTFNGKTIIEPGAYSQIKGAVEKALDVTSFGDVLLIDTGDAEANYNFGSGINGEKFQGSKAVSKFSSLDDFQRAISGGVLYDLAKYLFKPSSDIRVSGVSNLYYIKAGTTTAADVSFTFTGGGANGGSVTIKSLTEGVGANGVANSTIGVGLSAGFGAQMVAGTFDTSKFKFRFYKGSYRGVDNTVSPALLIDGITEAASTPELLAESPELNNVQELIDWCNNNSQFQSYFYLSASTVTGTGVIDSADLTTNAAFKLFANATQSFDSADFDAVLAAVTELDYTYVMTDLFGTNACEALNTKLYNHIKNDADYDKFMIVGGGADATLFNDPTDTTTPEHSVQIAEYYNCAKVYVVHSDIERPKSSGVGIRRYSTLFHAAMVLGRMAGVEPQVPITWAEIDVLNVIDDLSKPQREYALQKGVMHLRYIEGRGGWIVNQDINSKQDNSEDIYEDGTSPHGSIMRITAQLNKELIQGVRNRFVAMSNVNISSSEDVKSYIENFLQQKVASATDDNLLISFQNVTVTLVSTDYNVTYAFVPNGPINRIFITGFMLPVNL